jgi:hypothetical protein
MEKFTITPNVIVCPHCDKEFLYNKVNGIAVLEIAQNLEARKRMHCRLTLDTLEREFPGGKLPPAIKKAVLDGYNDLARDLHTILGFGTEAE